MRKTFITECIMYCYSKSFVVFKNCSKFNKDVSKIHVDWV